MSTMTLARPKADAIEKPTNQHEAESVMGRLRGIKLEIVQATHAEQAQVDELREMLKAAEIALDEKRAPYLERMHKCEAALFAWFLETANDLPGTEKKKLLKGGQWGKAGSGFTIGNGRLTLTKEGMAAIDEAVVIGREVQMPVIRRQSQVEALAEAFPWLSEYVEACDEMDDAKAIDDAIALLCSCVAYKPTPDKKQADKFLQANPAAECDNLRVDLAAKFVLDGEVVTDANGRTMTIAWPPAAKQEAQA